MDNGYQRISAAMLYPVTENSSVQSLETFQTRHPPHLQDSKILTEGQPGANMRSAFSQDMSYIFQNRFNSQHLVPLCP